MVPTAGARSFVVSMPAPAPQPLQPGDFYYTPEGYLVFTEQYHRRRGSCCQNSCRHCPWKFRPKPAPEGASDQK
ncbi:hypothetical protein GCM10022407_19760 [Hymenobacter antarcticus]|uniref:Uncharacterized protein n=2 Tax=Hymenobacter antarcticus TaxID=486270 RepID=A0ABP7Q0Y3_9BACT